MLPLSGIQVVEREDPTSLIDLWGDRDLVIVVDAVCSDRDPGTLMIMESGVGSIPLTDDAWSRTGRGGTHAFGLVAAVALSRALHRLPQRLVLIGIEAAGLEHGEPLSAPVSAAVDPATEAVIRILVESGALPSRPKDGVSDEAAWVVREVDR
jgi:hydrogenase maturation protease